MSRLKEMVADYRGHGFRRQAETLELLLSSSPEAKKVRVWLKRNAREWVIEHSEFFRGCQPWEAELWHLSQLFMDFSLMGKWERASAQERATHSMKVAKLARQLANAIGEEIRPYYPPALEFFDDERAVDIIRRFGKQSAEALLSTTGYSADSQDGYERGKLDCFDHGEPQWRRSPAHALASSLLFPQWQELSPMLRRLAEHAEQSLKEPKRDKRPNIPNADARAFARYLADDFKLFFGKTPNEVIAACVVLKFPNIDPPPDESTIRDWRGVK